MNYNFYLEKGSRKFNCPNCNKKTFVRYISNITNTYVNTVYGRCDRESKCKYHRYPSSNNITTYQQQTTTVNQQPQTRHIPKSNSISFHDIEHLIKTMLDYNSNNFITYLKKHFAPVDIKKAINKYHIGTSYHWKNSTVFWQIDQNYNIRAGKIMQYDFETGKRIKKPINRIYWMHKLLRIKNFHLKQCLFGLHLINEFEIEKYICIVESEKTAVIMSVLLPNYIWLATGNKSAFKIEFLEAIKHRKIIACPDKSCFNDWNDKATLLNKNGYKIEVNNLLEQYQLEEGVDFIDVLIT